MYQVLIKNGRIIDPANNINAILDIAVDNGKISQVQSKIEAEAVNEIDASGCLVVPGLIDHHAHVYPLAKIGIPAESVCFASGVTAVVDAGSTGARTFIQHKNFIAHSKLTIKAYLNVCPNGLDSLPARMEDVNPEHFDAGEIREIFEEEGGKNLLGLKLRTSKEIVRDLGYEPLKQTVKLAESLGLSVMVHCTNPPGEMSELLNYLRAGDIITHIYMNKGSTIIDEGRVSKSALEARKRGVIFEAADARAHFSFEVSEPAIAEGFYPDILATDLTKLSMHLRPTAFSMANQLTKYNMLEIPEEKLFALCTVNPARHMKLNAGTLSVNAPADIAIFRREERAQIFGDRPFADETAQFREGRIIYRPVLTIKNGEIVFRDIEF